MLFEFPWMLCKAHAQHVDPTPFLHHLACAACITTVICHGCPAQVTVCTYALVPVPAYVGKKDVTLSREMLPEEAMVLLSRKGKNIKPAGASQQGALRAALEQRGLLVKAEPKEAEPSSAKQGRQVKHLLS